MRRSEHSSGKFLVFGGNVLSPGETVDTDLAIDEGRGQAQDNIEAGWREVAGNSLNIDPRSLLVHHAQSRLDRCRRFNFPRFGFA